MRTSILATTSLTALALAATVVSAPAASAANAPDCSYHQLKVTESDGGAATGHIGIAIRFRNHSDTACSLTGYPGAAGLNKHGKQVQQAKRTKRGFIGGLKPGHSIPTITLPPGDVASALIEGTDVPQGNHAHCRTLHGLLVTPPNTKKSVRLKDAPPDCSRIQIHPVVRGKNGSQGA
jgi:hypothetical protein